jgi:predicted dehydrogenase
MVSRSVLGANDRIQVGFVGLGARAGLLDAAWLKQEDCNVAAICDVNAARIDAYQTKKLTDQNVPARGWKVDSFTDYRRMLDRKDIDAVLICAPDHQHAPIMMAAVEAGKDVYVDKPASNTIEAAVAMLKAYRSHKQVVQLGTQQRSWTHFRDAAKLIWDGYIGDVTHVVVAHGGGAGGPGGGRGAAPTGATVTPVPEGLDWNAFLGPAKKVAYDPRRYSSWRSYYDYGGGLITDWGVHWMDIVHLCMKADYPGSSYTSSVSVPNADPKQVSTDWFINYKYENFLMTFLGFVPPTTEPVADGPTFYGTKGWLRVNRNGYIVRANRAAVRLAFTPAGQAAAGGGRGTQGAAPQGAPQGQPPARGQAGGAGGGGGRGGTQAPAAITEITQVDPAQNVPGERGSEVVHVRNFLDCVKSRQKPTAEFEIGFHSTLPCLLGRLSVQQQRAVIWDEKNLVARLA